jgi:exosome complex component RRP41
MAGSYTKRADGRTMDGFRPIKAQVGVIDSADGSAMFETGKTRAIAVVRGPRKLHPKHMENPEKGILRVSYQMMSFSVWDRIKPGMSRRGQEIGKVTEWALQEVVDLDAFPNAVVDVIIQIPQADAGTRVAGINAAAMALAQAGVPMKEMVSAIAVGKVDKTIVVDVNYDEEHYKEGECSTDIPMAFTSNSQKITLLQLDGRISTKEMAEAVEAGKVACQKILAIQTEALKNVGELITR